MIALRQFHSLENETITIKIPAEFKHYQQAEIIILPLENVQHKNISTEAFIKQFAGAIPDFPDCDSDVLPEERDFLCVIYSTVIFALLFLRIILWWLKE